MLLLDGGIVKRSRNPRTGGRMASSQRWRTKMTRRPKAAPLARTRGHLALAPTTHLTSNPLEMVCVGNLEPHSFASKGVPLRPAGGAAGAPLAQLNDRNWSRREVPIPKTRDVNPQVSPGPIEIGFEGSALTLHEYAVLNKANEGREGFRRRSCVVALQSGFPG